MPYLEETARKEIFKTFNAFLYRMNVYANYYVVMIT